jgi:AIPR protein
MVPAKIIRVKTDNLNPMVAAISRSANSQNTVQPADFSANDPFHVKVEEFANNTWLPDQKGRWFYERARGSYGAAELKASFRATEKRRFAAETPKERRFSKPDLAKYLNAWDGLPNLVSFGNQKNFQSIMQTLKEQHPDRFIPDETWFRAFVAKAIIFRTVQAIVKAKKFPAYQANITVYTVGSLSWKSGGSVDFERIWSQQAVSPGLRAMIGDWVVEIDKRLRDTAKGRMPSEWAKKADCWDAIRDAPLPLPDPLPPEVQIYTGPSRRRATA